MGEVFALRALGRHVAVCVGYALCYALLRDISVSHWNLPAGLRVACLLLLPYRYWPALLLGELIPVSHHAWSHMDDFGWRWSALAALPPMLPVMAVVAWVRRHARLLQDRQQVNMPMLLGVIFAGALVTAFDDVMVVTAATLPTGMAAPLLDAQVAFGYFLGNYLGALAIAPSAIAIYMWQTGRVPAALEAPLWRSRLAKDMLVGVLTPLLVLMVLVFSSQGDGMQVFRIAMFLPVVWLTLRHGWQGAALGGTLASIAVTLTSSMVRDPAVIQAQALIAFAITTLLMLGSRIAQQAQVNQNNHVDALRGFQLAQQGLYLEELRLRQAADALEHLGHNIRDNHNRLLDRLRHVLPSNEERSYSKQVALAQHEMHRLANALYPRGWRERGVPATLREGPFAQAIHMAGATYDCELSGRGLSQLAPDVHMALYRLACEVLVHVLSRGPMQHIQLQLRGGNTKGRRWVVMRLMGSRATTHTPMHDIGRGEPADSEAWKQAMTLLGASGLGISSIRDRTHIYGGDVHLREVEQTVSVTLLLHDSLRSSVPHRGTPGAPR
ncbi:MASE1 domain-containing protein [Dyella telluris]|uniref:MASE1 domain-containing protein n=1 Tax=Dyella telluris TaxID=2763498 RepID=A0A7G8Q3X7_9GAMM|nr:MASE1 domain-containing protein [Dyella telluris]QNK01485.1 MASE1 domain-containing protein [Dyella telluris]